MGSNLHIDQLAAMAELDLNERRLVKHRPVALALRSRSPVADEVIELAQVQIDRWKKHSLCSSDYISAWENLLQNPDKAASVLEERTPRAAALRQNSPFVASVRKFNALAHAA